MHFGESAWSFPLVIGLADAGALDVRLACKHVQKLILTYIQSAQELLDLAPAAESGLLGWKEGPLKSSEQFISTFRMSGSFERISCRARGMQLAFSIIILNDDFMGVPFQTQIEHAKRWRTSVAHVPRFRHRQLKRSRLLYIQGKRGK